ncbi:MAG: SAM-dependent methyltransferase, partial [Bacteroidetes bacterium]
MDLIKQMNYEKFIDPKIRYFWQNIHEVSWENKVQISSFFALTKLQISLENLVLPANNFDLIYYDAFAPSKQSEIWQPENLQKVYDLLKPNGILVTYCAKGQFKRDLIKIGFEIESPKGSIGKQEMVRATKKNLGNKNA